VVRLFGYIGENPVKISYSISSSEIITEEVETLDKQMKVESDGWGIGFYQGKASFILKKAVSVLKDERFRNITEAVSSKVIIAHVRKATVGEVKEANTHPFRYGVWLFAHQGTISDFRKIKPRIKKSLPVSHRKKIKGTTDSEYSFFLFLHNLRRAGSIIKGNIPLRKAENALKKTIKSILEYNRTLKSETGSTLNFLITNGRYLLASKVGIPLYYISRNEVIPKKIEQISDETLLKIKLEPLQGGGKSVIIASEKITDEEGWKEPDDFSVISVDENFKINILPLDIQ